LPHILLQYYVHFFFPDKKEQLVLITPLAIFLFEISYFGSGNLDVVGCAVNEKESEKMKSQVLNGRHQNIGQGMR